MSYADYFAKFKPGEIRRLIDADQAKQMTPAAFSERVHFILDVAAKTPVYPVDKSIVLSTDLNQILVYSLYKLDRAKFYLVPGKRNVNLNSMELLDTIQNDDPMMRTFVDDEIRREYVTVAVIVTCLYLLAMCKKVELKTMLSMSADAKKAPLMKTHSAAIDMLKDCRRFSHKGYDKAVLLFMNQSRQSLIPNKKRAF